MTHELLGESVDLQVMIREYRCMISCR